VYNVRCVVFGQRSRDGTDYALEYDSNAICSYQTHIRSLTTVHPLTLNQPCWVGRSFTSYITASRGKEHCVVSVHR